MTREEFNNYYHLHSIEKCCFFCKYNSGYIELLRCVHPYRNANEQEYVEATQICDAYESDEDGQLWEQ